MRLAALRTDTCPILQHCFRKSWQETVPLHGIFRGTLLTTRDDGGNRVAGEKSHPQRSRDRRNCEYLIKIFSLE